MATSRVSAIVGAALLGSTLAVVSSTSFAADLGCCGAKDIPPPPPPSHRTVYLKGTIGMSSVDVGSIWTDGTGSNGYQTGNFTVEHEDIKSSPLFGVGIGVEANRWLRFDVTGEYRGKQLFVGQDRFHGGPVADWYTNEYTADLETWVGLVNGYIDLGTWRGVTPYVGAGVGFASISVEGFKDVNVPNNSVFYGDGSSSSTNFAWALYGGISYDVTQQFTLDLGYRYLDLGDVHTGTATAFDGSSSYEGLEIRDITSHDMLLSARYRLDAPASYPMVLK